MDIFFLVPNKEGSLFLYEYDDSIFQCQVYLDKENGKIDLICFPISYSKKRNKHTIDEDHINKLSKKLLSFFQNKHSETKIGAYFKDSPNLYKYVLKNASFIPAEENKVTAIFNIHNNSYIFESMIPIKKDNKTLFSTGNDSYLHNLGECGCIDIKNKNDILISSCLFCLEFEDIILRWLEKTYDEESLTKTHNNEPKIIKYSPIKLFNPNERTKK